MSSGVVIAGAGQGGYQVAASLRSEGYEESITLIGDEPSLPYQRPPLSKTFMAGKHQFDSKLQMAGLSQGSDLAVTRGAPESKNFSVLYFKQQQLVAIDSINRPADHMAGRKLLAAGTSLTPAQAADLSMDLKSLAV